MGTKSTTQPANGTRSATDIVELVQQLDASGNVVGSATGTVDTELPAAATPGDTDANEANPSIKARLQAWTGSAWARLTGDTANGLDVDVTRVQGGNVADAAADSGNPVKTGGIYSATRPTYTDGQRGNIQLDNRGSQRVAIWTDGAGSSIGSSSGGDGINPGVGLTATSVGYAFSGVTSTYDRLRNNTSSSVLASAARTVTTSSPDQVTYNATTLQAVLSVTSAGTGSIQLTIEGKDSISGAYYALNATPTAVTANGTYVYEIGPGGTATGGVTQRTAGAVPRTVRITVTHGNANSITYSVSLVCGV